MREANSSDQDGGVLSGKNSDDEEDDGINNDISMDGDSDLDKENEDDLYNFLERE